MDPVLSAALSHLLQALISVFFIALSALIVKLREKAQAGIDVVKNDVGTQQFYLLQQFVTIAVREAEQLGVLGAIESKKAYAIQVVQNFATAHGIPVDVANIESMIEAAIRADLQIPVKPAPDAPPTPPVATNDPPAPIVSTSA